MSIYQFKSVLVSFRYKPGFYFDCSETQHPGYLLLEMVTAPVAIIETGKVTPFTLKMILPRDVLEFCEVRSLDLLIGLVVYWERHEMDEYFMHEIAQGDHTFKKVDGAYAWSNLRILEAHSDWFKRAPRPVLYIPKLNIDMGILRSLKK